MLKACLLVLAANQALAFSSLGTLSVGTTRLHAQTSSTLPYPVMSASTNKLRLRDQELLAVLQGQTVEPTWYGQMAVPGNQKTSEELSDTMAAVEHRYRVNEGKHGLLQ